MNRWSTLIDLEHETVYLGELIEKEAPDEKIEEEFDRLCMEYFGYTRNELTGEVSRVVLSGLDEWALEEVLYLGERHGFDFEEKAGKKGLPANSEFGYVIHQWVYFAEMMIAKECGFFPSTSDEVAAVKLNRQARIFEKEIRRKRQLPRTEDAEREKVFGMRAREIKPGSILAPMTKSKGTKGVREVQIEVRTRDRRPPHGPAKRP